MEATKGSQKGSTNADLWLADSETDQGGSLKEEQWSYNKDLPLLTGKINIDPITGMTNSQIRFLMEGKDKSVVDEVMGKYQDLDLSFVIPKGQQHIVGGSEKYVAIQ